MKSIVLIVGPSGSGKTNLMNITFEQDQLIRSVTTRHMRPGEIDGQNYKFILEKDFRKLESDNQLIQSAYYDGNYYGVTKEEVNDKLKHFDTIAIAVVMPTVKDYIKYGEETGIKVIPVFASISKDNLLKHFENRTESEDLKLQRIQKYETEMDNIKFFNPENVIDMNENDFGQKAKIQLLGLIEKLEDEHKGEQNSMGEKKFNAHLTGKETYDKANNSIFGNEQKTFAKDGDYFIVLYDKDEDNGGHLMPLGLPIGTLSYSIDEDLAIIDKIIIIPSNDDGIKDITILLNILSWYFFAQQGVKSYKIKNEVTESEIIPITETNEKSTKEIVEKYIDIRSLRSDEIQSRG